MSASATQGGHKKEDRNHRAKIQWPAVFHRATVIKDYEAKLLQLLFLRCKSKYQTLVRTFNAQKLAVIIIPLSDLSKM